MIILLTRYNLILSTLEALKYADLMKKLFL